MNSTCSCSLKGGGRGSRLHVWDEDADEVRPLKGARRGRRRRQRPLGPAAGLRCPPGAGSCRGRTSLTDAPAAAFSRPAPRARHLCGAVAACGGPGPPRAPCTAQGQGPSPRPWGEARGGVRPAGAVRPAVLRKVWFGAFSFFKSLLRNLTPAADCGAPGEPRGARAQPAASTARLTLSDVAGRAAEHRVPHGAFAAG